MDGELGYELKEEIKGWDFAYPASTVFPTFFFIFLWIQVFV